MSHGCSGDIWRRDYTQPEGQQEAYSNIEAYTEGLLQIAFKAYSNIEYAADADLAMAEVRPTLNYRIPDSARLEWAKQIGISQVIKVLDAVYHITKDERYSVCSSLRNDTVIDF